MGRSGLAVILAASAITLPLLISGTAHAKSRHHPMATRDTATVQTTGDLTPPPGVAILIGAQGSSDTGLRARPVVACDRFVSEDLKGPGDFHLASAPGKHLYVCSYSISNGSALQNVQFLSGTATASSNGQACTRGRPITAKFHLLSNQFVSQGSGVGSLFTVPGEGLCAAVSGPGHVSVNITYASF